MPAAAGRRDDLTILNALRFLRVAAPSICFVPWAALASCWPLPQQLLPVSAAGGGRRRCCASSAELDFYICVPETPAGVSGTLFHQRGRKDERQLLTVTTPPVKRRLERPAGRDKREIKNNSSAEDGQSASGGHFKSSSCTKAPGCYIIRKNTKEGLYHAGIPRAAH